MKSFIPCGAAIGAVLLLPGVATAQSPNLVDANAQDDDTIVVTANRTQRRLSDVGESVSIIGEKAIIERQPTEVLDLLRTVPGLTFNSNGGIGTSTSVSIRGANSDQTVVLIDGVKLNDPASPGGGFNFGSLLTGNIARVEVVRGSQSVLYGSQAIGGVINLLTREPTEDLAAFARAEYGERDTAQLVGNVSQRFGPVAVSAGGNYLRTDGISAFGRARGGSEPDGFESWGANGKVDVYLTETISLDLRGFYADSETEVDGFPAPDFALADTDEISRRADFVGYGGLNATFMDGRFRNRIGFAYTNIDRQNIDRSGDSDVETFDANGENRRFEYQGVFEATDYAELVFGAETETSEFRSSSYGGPAATAEVGIDSIYGQINLTPLAGLSLTGGVRYDNHETFGGNTVFAVSGAYTPNAGSTTIRGSFGEGFKAPALYQLYSEYGNEALQPEQSDSWDVGVTQRLVGGLAEIGVTYFRRDTENQIAFVSCFQNPDPVCVDRPNGTYGNIARTNADGVEVGLALRPAAGFDLSANYSFIDTQDEATGNVLARQPKHKVSLVANYRLPSGIAFGGTIVQVGDSFDNASNSRALDGYVTVDLRASVPVAKGVELYGRAENLFDAEYETVFRYGTAPQTFLGGVRLVI